MSFIDVVSSYIKKYVDPCEIHGSWWSWASCDPIVYGISKGVYDVDIKIYMFLLYYRECG